MNGRDPDGLAPSTISLWIPEKESSASSEHQTATDTTALSALGGGGSASFEKALTPGLEGKDTGIAPKVASGSAAEVPVSAPEAVPSAQLDMVPSTASGPTTSTKPDAIPASVPEPAPYSAPKATPLTNPEKVIESAPEVATSSITKAAHNTDPEKVATLTAVPNGKGSPASSHLEKEIDLEAGHRSEDSEKKEPERTGTEVDPNVVDWDGPDDPQNPMNWPEKLKWANIAVIASITFLTQVSLQAPSIESMMLTRSDRSQPLGLFHACTCGS